MANSWTGKSDAQLDATVSNDGFYPDLVLGDLQTVYRIPAEYAEAMVAEHVRLAMADINAELAAQKLLWIESGLTTLNSAELILRYKRAVFTKTKGLLLMQFAAMNRRTDPDTQDDYQYWLGISRKNVARLLGKTGIVNVELL